MTLTTFSDLGLAEPILRALTEENYTVPTPIQAQAIPLVLNARDLVAIAQTGTGKTAAFALPILHRLAEDKKRMERRACRVLVLSPTRELSAQILDSFLTYGRHLRITATLAIGGVSMGRQVKALSNGIDVLVATPGRLLDLSRAGALRLDHVDTLVLDEADRMLDMGFIHDIRKIIGKLPSDRQTLLLSATMPQGVSELASKMLRDPARVAVTPVASTAERIAQRVIHVDRNGKPALLAKLLSDEAIERAIVFARTKHGADKIARSLVKSGIGAEAIHGNKSQNQRTRTLDAFRSGAVRTLIATDIAARGIDVDGISHVINFDLPEVAESYVHRIGRTARAGADGVAISFCSGDEVPLLRAIERTIRMSIAASGDARQSSGAREEQPRGNGRRQNQGRPKHARHNQKKQASSRGHGPSSQGYQASGGSDIGQVGFLSRKDNHRRGTQAPRQHQPSR